MLISPALSNGDSEILPDTQRQVDVSEMLSLENIIQIANQHNRDIEQAAIAVQQAQAAVDEQNASYQPTLGVSAGSDYDLPFISESDDGMDLDAGIDLSYTLLDFGRRAVSVDISQAELEVAKERG
ncbi:MAG: TolC family protein [Cyanobacteria bacterium J06650_10]